MDIKKGDIVGRISYKKDILFKVCNIIKNRRKEDIAILRGVTVRIIADAPISDLERIDKEKVKEHINLFEQELDDEVRECINEECKNKKKSISSRGYIKLINGKVLHLDGDRIYAEKSLKYYKRLGINAIVKNISESRQSLYIRNLLEKYNPNILVITRTRFFN